MMKKLILTVLVISLFIFSGCNNTLKSSNKIESDQKQKELTNTIQEPKINKQNKTEDEIVQEEFEKLIKETENTEKTREKLEIQDININDIEILDITPSDLNLID